MENDSAEKIFSKPEFISSSLVRRLRPFQGMLTWPHNASCGATKVSRVRSSQFFFLDEAFVVLTDPVPSTNYHNGNNNMQSIV